jgi:hypothetical protein
MKLKVMSIVHGQSEYRICSSIKSNLRLKHEIIAREKGKTSIQITSILDVLNDKRFNNFKNFINYFDGIEYKRQELIGFSLFIIMDVDDCTPIQKRKFISKEMFKGHWLYDYIVPIYNDPNLEKTMQEANISVNKKKNYILIFPTNHGDLDIDIAKEFLNKLEKCNCSNLNEYVSYCILIAEENLLL